MGLLNNSLAGRVGHQPLQSVDNRYIRPWLSTEDLTMTYSMGVSFFFRAPPKQKTNGKQPKVVFLALTKTPI